MTGQDLQQLLLQKWGRSYDVQFRRVQGKVFLQIMWKYLGQASFPMTEAEYLDRLSTAVGYLLAWGCTDQVRVFIEQTRDRPRLGKAVNVPLNLGERASEWMLGDF